MMLWMTLKEWMIKNQINQREVAKYFHIDNTNPATNVSRYINGGSETQLFDGGHNSSVYTYQAENNRQGYGLSFEFLDSPSTTGVLTYYVQFKTDNTGVTLYMNQNSGGQGGNMFVVLKEVLA